jgi:CRISPR-associated endonuclease/helicase Cas3
MNKQTQALWAKKEETAGRFYWLPLTVHLQDTMNVSRWLWNNWISDGQREFCINSISTQDEETASNTAAFLGAIHDIGKATPAFQVKRTYGSSSDLDEMLLEKLERAGFFGISQLELTNPEKSHHSIAGEYLLKEEFHVKDDIGSIIGGHHGKPVDESLKIDNQSSYTANYYQTEDSTSDIYGRWRNVQRDIFQWSLEESGFDSIDGLPEISKPAQVLFSGLLIMADWISSNRDYFPLVDLQTEYVPDAKARYQNGITAWSENVPLQLQNYPSISDKCC